MSSTGERRSDFDKLKHPDPGRRRNDGRKSRLEFRTIGWRPRAVQFTTGFREKLFLTA